MNRPPVSAKLVAGLGLLAFFLGAALLAPYLAAPPGAKNLAEQLLPPSPGHWFGQNQHGEDLFSIVLHGTRVSLLIGLATVLCSMAVGVPVGLLSGYLGGFADRAASGAMEIVLAFPGILLAVAIAAVMGASVANVVIALSAGGWVAFARLVRAQTLSLREREFVLAARAMGAGTPSIVLRHVLPQLAGTLAVQATFAFAAAILAESSLSFLGLGAPPGTPSWGGAVSDGVRYLLAAPHLATFPGLAVMLSVFAFNLLGDALKDRLDGR